MPKCSFVTNGKICVDISRRERTRKGSQVLNPAPNQFVSASKFPAQDCSDVDEVRPIRKRLRRRRTVPWGQGSLHPEVGAMTI